MAYRARSSRGRSGSARRVSKSRSSAGRRGNYRGNRSASRNASRKSVTPQIQLVLHPDMLTRPIVAPAQGRNVPARFLTPAPAAPSKKSF